MLVQVVHDSHTNGGAKVNTYLEETLAAALERFGNRVTRVEVSLTDQNGAKGGDTDKRCTLEARLAGMQPIAVHNDAGNIDDAIDGAVDKLVQLLDKTVARQSDHKGRPSMGGAE
jgi:ribosome-associated translation inhibitor RaiA